MEEKGWSVPEFVEGFKALRLQQGNDAMFEGRVAGEPLPKVAWTRGGKSLPSSEKYELHYDPSSGDVSLTIRNLGPGDEGEYCCTISNAYGSVSATLSVNPEKSCNSSNDSLRATLQRQKVLREQQSKQAEAAALSIQKTQHQSKVSQGL